LSATVGLISVLQQTPREITVDVPSLVITPPEVAVVPVILLIAEVVTMGGSSFLQLKKKI
jgi:hypothetical protein